MSVRELRAHLFPKRAADTGLDPVVLAFRQLLVERNATAAWADTDNVPDPAWIEMLQAALLGGGFRRSADRDLIARP